jgi:LacI family transcriptional regulator
MRKKVSARRDLRIGFVVPSMHLNARRILSGVCAYARINKSWHVRVANGDSDLIFPRLRKAGIDGAFITAPVSQERSADEYAAHMPCIALGCLIVPKVSPYLTADSVSGGRAAAQHFLDLGLHNFAYFSTSNVYWSQMRMKGFVDRLKESGFEPAVFASGDRSSPSRDWQAGRVWAKGLDDVIKWLRSLPKPVGLMACDDPMGYDIIEAAEEAGINVPEEVAVIGLYNDVTLCNAAQPPLSSVELNLEKAGYEAAVLLNDIILGRRKMKGQVIMAEVVEVVKRQSSDIIATPDPQVALALHFIRTHFHQPIQVADVVSATTSARRTLEVRFRQLLNRSILDEIMRMRIEHVAEVLLNSDLSIEEVATASAFESAGYMARLFKRAKGVSPLAFRKAHRAAATN